MKVGIFFKVINMFLTDAVTVADGEPYGEAIQYGGHYDFHEQLIPVTSFEQRFKVRDYDFYPRGRVVFFHITNLFRIYIDPCLFQDDIQHLVELFELTDAQYETTKDEHYRCEHCNKNYVA